MELRAIQKRNRDEAVRARKAGEPKQRPAYGYVYVRLVPAGKVDHVEIDPVAAEVIREVARRILADKTGKVTCATEAARLTREGIPVPSDRRAQLYGRKLGGAPWSGKTVRYVLRSEASLGFLMHGGRPVTGEDGRPVRIAAPLWDRPTHDALLEATAPRHAGSRAPKGARLLSGVVFCGNCGVSGWFLARYGAGEVMRKVYDPGTGHGAQVAELEAVRRRLRDDRQAGLYDSADDAEWCRAEYRRLGEEIGALRLLPERAPAMRMVPAGRTIAAEWQAADDARRREMLAEFEVRVVLHPRGRARRVAVAGMDIGGIALAG